MSRYQFSKLDLLSYSLGSFGTGVFSAVPTVLLLYYCTETLEIAPSYAAIIVFLPKVWALVWDPIVGGWSDGTASRFGRRSPFLLTGAIGVSISFVLLFNSPSEDKLFAGIYVASLYFIMASAYSVYAVPYLAIPAEASDDPAVRERILAWRLAFAMAGVLIGSGLAPHLIAIGGGGQEGYRFMSVAVALVCGLGMYAAYRFSRKIETNSIPVAASTWAGRIGPILRNTAFLRLAASYSLLIASVAVVLSATPYLTAFVLRRPEAEAGNLLTVLLAVSMLSMPIWAWIVRRAGTWRALFLASILFGATALMILYFDAGTSIAITLALFCVLGLFFAGMQLVPFTLLAHMAHAASSTGQRNEGLYTGLWTASEKLGLALGPAALGVGLSLIGFAPGVAAQSQPAQDGIGTIMALGPMLLVFGGLALVSPEILRSMRIQR